MQEFQPEIAMPAVKRSLVSGLRANG